MSEAQKVDSIIIEYFKLNRTYQKQYGPSTLVLLQVGAFFEVYGLRNPYQGTYEMAPIQSFADHCSLNIAEKKFTLGTLSAAAPPSSSTTLPPFPDDMTNSVIAAWIRNLPPCQVVMAGVRDHQLEKYIQRMVEVGFTVVVYNQEKSGKDFVRNLEHIYSPGTFLSHEPDAKQRISNHITCVWLSKVGARAALKTDVTTRDVMICGMASMNIFTGESYIFEYQTAWFLTPTTFDELDRHLTTFMPNEIIFVSELSKDQVGSMLKYLSLPEGIAKHYVYVNEPVNGGGSGSDHHLGNVTVARNCTKHTYIHAQLTSIFAEDVFTTCMEFQTHIIATQAFCYLMHFVETHNSDLVRKLQFPVFSNTSHRMVLANHTLKQLNIIPDGASGVRPGRFDSVVSFLNQCQTSMGKRRFEHQLVHPVFDVSWLQREYAAVDHILAHSTHEERLQWRRQLRAIRDVERMARQLVTKRMLPSTLAQFYHTLMAWRDIYTEVIRPDAFYHAYVVDDSAVLSAPFRWKHVLDCIDFLETTFVLEICEHCHSIKDCDEPMLRSEKIPELAECLSRKSEVQGRFDAIHASLNELMNHGAKTHEEYVRRHKTDKGGISLQITKKRGATLKQLLQQQHARGGGGCDVQIVKASSLYDEIVSPELRQITHDLLQIEEELNHILIRSYGSIIQDMTERWYELMETVAKQIATWDVLVTKAHVAHEYRYCRPHIAGDTESPSWVKAHGLRHVLIEQIQTSEIYVTNDVALGEDPERGILLYGTNAVGKTSLIRALGISIILAQAGCYVPCSHFEFRPYRSIFSRILGNDNLFKGLSTFAVEMAELRLILKMSDTYSLVLGDELCSGTEIESALSIFMAGLMHLYRQGASFLFATHFHEILKFQELRDLTGIAVKHMSVIYDPVKDYLIYDRILKDGPGNGTYGIEVAKSMHMDQEFLEQAYHIRRRYFTESSTQVLEQKPSHFNAKKLCGMCEMCHQHVGEEIHHLQFQKDANTDGFIDHFHKNHAANLMSICTSCHDQLHRDATVATKTVRKKTTKGHILQSQSQSH